VHRGEVRQVALYDLCAEPPQGFGARVLASNQGAHLVPPCEQEFGEVAADAAHSAGCSGYEDRVVVFMFRHLVADLGLLQKTNWRRGARAGTNGRGHTPGGSARLVCFASSRARGDASGAAEFSGAEG
jgi:hypothetical protein